jgi:hypothetical protein
MSHALTYDTQPPHSRLKRELINGVLRIVAEAEEPGPLVRRTALLRAAIPASLICFVVLMVGLAIFGGTYQANRRYMDSSTSLILIGAFVIFCAALFALVWRTQYAVRLDACAKALKQNTLLAASPGRLLVESAGPIGTSTLDLNGTIRSLRIARCETCVDCLQIMLADGTRIHVLPGRDEPELRWVAKTLGAVIGQPD